MTPEGKLLQTLDRVSEITSGPNMWRSAALQYSAVLSPVTLNFRIIAFQLESKYFGRREVDEGGLFQVRLIEFWFWSLI